MKQEDPRLIGPYRLVGRLGAGGMGQVFLGLSAGGRPVAVKVIRAELAADQEFRVRFSREVAAARRVSGLFTALVMDADVDGPVPWLATAYISGPSLAQAVTNHGPMAVPPALALAAGLAEGLSAIHGAGVVHCDLKPSNVLLSPDGPRVIDFGISRAAEAVSVTGVGWVVGSPGFMSPEQAMGEEVGPPSDVFSLGAVLTFAATGGGPFGKGSRPELAYRLVYSPPDLDLVPAQLRPLVERCLAKDPRQRPTADEVLASAAQPAAGWLADALGTFAQPTAQPAAQPAARLASERAAPVPLPPQDLDEAAALVPGLREPSGRPRPRSRPRRWWRPVAAAGATASVLSASVAVSLALTAAVQRPSAPPLAPRAEAAAPSSSAPAASSSAPAAPRPRPGSVRSSSTPGPAPKPAIIPDIATVTSPGSPTTRSPTTRPPTATPSATTTAPRSPSASPSPSPTPTSSPTPTPSPNPTSSPAPTSSLSPTSSPSPSTSPSAPVPQITGADIYQQGVWVYFDVHYTDPGNDAQGFGFMGVNGLHWVEESYPFSASDPGIVGPDSIAYPLDLECGTAWQHQAEVEVWIDDTEGASSQPVVIRMACQD